MSADSAIFIATTEGPARVLAILRETGDPPSAMFRDGEFKRLRISGAYREFVEGLVAKLCGHRAFRTDVSRSIDQGDSWQLGMLVAHIVEADGRLAPQAQVPRRVIWCSGSVKYVTGSLSEIAVGKIDFLPRKLELSATELQAAGASGAEVWVALSEKDDSPDIRGLVQRICPTAQVAAFGHIPLNAFKEFWCRRAPAPAKPRKRQVAAVALVLGTACAVALASWWELRPEPATGAPRATDNISPPRPPPAQSEPPSSAPSESTSAVPNWMEGVHVTIRASFAQAGTRCMSASKWDITDREENYSLAEYHEIPSGGTLCGGRIDIDNQTSSEVTVHLTGAADGTGSSNLTVSPGSTTNNYLTLGRVHQSAQLQVQSAQPGSTPFSRRLFSIAE